MPKVKNGNFHISAMFIINLQYVCLNICFEQLDQNEKGQNARWPPILPQVYYLPERIIVILLIIGSYSMILSG